MLETLYRDILFKKVLYSVLSSTHLIFKYFRLQILNVVVQKGENIDQRPKGADEWTEQQAEPP